MKVCLANITCASHPVTLPNALLFTDVPKLFRELTPNDELDVHPARTQLQYTQVAVTEQGEEKGDFAEHDADQHFVRLFRR